jgi:alkylation response protein AidB-like acyl-CoA dehydrogenase
MDFNYSEEQLKLKKFVEGFAKKELVPFESRWSEGEPYLREVMKNMAEHGLLGVTIPQQYGGMELGTLDAAIMIEELARYSPNASNLLAFTSLGPVQFVQYLGNDQQKERFLSEVVGGEKLWGIGITEPNTGSAATEMATTAKRDGDHFILNGSKIYVSYATVADYFVIYARCSSDKGGRGIGGLILEKGTPGFTIAKGEMNMAGGIQAELFFENCRVPEENVLIETNAFKHLMGVYNAERIGGTAMGLGTAQGAFDKSKEYVQIREQFGKPLWQFQGVQWKIADMAINLEAARLLLYKAASNVESGIPLPIETSIAKVFAAEMAQKVTNEAIQLHGAYGYMQHSGIEKLFRTIRSNAIAGGTTEIHRSMIAGWTLDKRINHRE